MYFDNKPCAVCGSDVELDGDATSHHPREPDATVDARVCTNGDCPTNSGDADAPVA